jgi:hypothetical protein
MELKNLLNATDSAKFLGLKHRTEFFTFKEIHKLKPVERIGNVWLYSIRDLKKLKGKLA